MLNDNSYNSLVDVTVGEILEIYKNDTELLKHILIAKAEEDKVSMNNNIKHNTHLIFLCIIYREEEQKR
jgi:hypothetical protein